MRVAQRVLARSGRLETVTTVMSKRKLGERRADSLIGTAEAATILKMSTAAVRELACDGEIPWEIDAGRYYFVRSDVQELADELCRVHLACRAARR